MTQSNDGSTGFQRGVALAATVVARFAVLAVVAGPLLIHAGILTPFGGFKLFTAGLVPGGLLSLLLGAAGFFASRGETAATPRARSLAAMLVGAGLAALLLFASWPGMGLPRINDITTSPDDAPVFRAASRDPANAGRDMGYPPAFAAEQRAAYPDLSPIVLPVPPKDAWERIAPAAEAIGLDVVLSSPGDGMLEARQTSRLFAFVDDVVVRVRPDPTDPGRSVVDVRSKSRDGKGDLGANARRIRALRDALTKG